MEQTLTGLVFAVKRFAVHDGDGIRTTLFLKGCPLSCVWCHNPEGLSFEPQMAFYRETCTGCGACAGICKAHTVDGAGHTFDRTRCTVKGACAAVCPHGALKLYGTPMTVKQAVTELTADRMFYTDGGGITLSGGECLCQPEFCRAVLAACKEQGINTAVDTCGCVPFAAFEQVLPYTDTVLYDVKAVSPSVHKACTGVTNELILENLQRLDEAGTRLEIRVPYVPGYNDGEMEAIARLVGSLSHVTKVRLLPYHNYAAGKYEALVMPDTLPKRLPQPEELQQAADCFHRAGCTLAL